LAHFVACSTKKNVKDVIDLFINICFNVAAQDPSLLNAQPFLCKTHEIEGSKQMLELC